MARSKSTKSTTVHAIKRRWDNSSLIIPKVQRDLVWTLSQKQLLIDSLLKDFDIPKIYFRDVEIDGKQCYEIVDGQQRINAIIGYMNGEFALPDDCDPVQNETTANKTYAELSDDLQLLIDDRNLDIVHLIDYSDEEMEETFLRLQNGSPLKAAEKRRAIQGNMREIVEELASHKFFLNCCDFKNDHYAYEDMCSKALCILLNGGPTAIGARALKKMYENNRTIKASDSAPSDLRKAYNFLDKSFKKAAFSPHMKKYASVDLPIIVSSLLKTFDLGNYPEEFAKAYLSFLDEYGSNRELPEDKQNPKLLAYANAARGDSLEYLEYRQNLLKENLLEKMPYLAVKDQNRLFTPEQRAIIFRRDEGVCQECGKKCTEDNYHADHIVPYSKGGATQIANGRVLCPECNLKKNNKTAAD